MRAIGFLSGLAAGAGCIFWLQIQEITLVGRHADSGKSQSINIYQLQRFLYLIKHTFLRIYSIGCHRRSIWCGSRFHLSRCIDLGERFRGRTNKCSNYCSLYCHTSTLYIWGKIFGFIQSDERSASRCLTHRGVERCPDPSRSLNINRFFSFSLQEKEFYVAVIGGSIIFAVLTLLCAKFTTIISSSIVGSGMIMASVDFFMHGSQTLLWVCIAWHSHVFNQSNKFYNFATSSASSFSGRPFTSNRIPIHRRAGVGS